MDRDTTYMINYLKNILTNELFNEFQQAQEKGIPCMKMVEIPKDLNRPFQISQDYSDLILDVINEMMESDNLINVTYDQYMDKLNKLFYTEVHEHKFREDSPRQVIKVYKEIFSQNCQKDCVDFIFNRSDKILKGQLLDILTLYEEKSFEASELETIVIDFEKESNKKNKGAPNSPIIPKLSPKKQQLTCPAPPLVPPPPPSDPPSPPSESPTNSPPESPHQPTVETQEESFSQDFSVESQQSPNQMTDESFSHEFSIEDQSLEDQNFESPQYSQEGSFTIDEEEIRERIKEEVTPSIFEKMSSAQSEGKLADLIPEKNEEEVGNLSSEIVDFINFTVQMDHLPDFTYDEYIEHLVQTYIDSYTKDDYMEDRTDF